MWKLKAVQRLFQRTKQTGMSAFNTGTKFSEKTACVPGHPSRYQPEVYS